MTQIKISPQAYNDVVSLLKKYYGINLPEVDSPQSDVRIQIESPAIGTELYELYASLTGGDNIRNDVLNTLALLSGYVLTDSGKCDGDSFRRTVERINRQDRLRLYIFCRNSEKDYEGITIRGKNGSVRLANTCNWLWNDLLKDYFARSLQDITDVGQAGAELVSGMRKRGRIPKDARVPALVWGTYRMMTDSHIFRSSMPNSLCHFIIKLLQIQNVLPRETDIDAMWIRAELRYIESRPEKPAYPSPA